MNFFNKRYALTWFLPMCLLAFCLSTVYNLLRPLKITLVTSAHAGTEIIPFLKVWGVLPMAVVFSVFYTKLLKHLNTEKIFITMCLFFLGFFAIFGLSSVCFAGKNAVLNSAIIRPAANIASVVTTLPISLGSGIANAVKTKDPMYAANGLLSGVLLTCVYAGVAAGNAVVWLPLVTRAAFIRDSESSVRTTISEKKGQIVMVPLLAPASAEFDLNEFFMLNGPLRICDDADGSSNPGGHTLY